MLVKSKHLLGGNLNTTNGTEGLLQVTVDTELSHGNQTNHGKTGTNTGVRSLDSELFSDLDKTGGGSLSWRTLGLVDLGQHGVGWLGDNGGSETGNETRSEVDTGLLGVGESGLVDLGVDGLNDLLEDDELGHGVWNPGKHKVSSWSPNCAISTPENADAAELTA